VGVSVAASNWSDAFTIPSECPASSLSAPKWVVAKVQEPRRVRVTSVADASAAPSTGSVPLPISSSRTRVVSSASSKTRRSMRT
jgi:hypothetical protein